MILYIFENGKINKVFQMFFWFFCKQNAFFKSLIVLMDELSVFYSI
jgi:hypothetical protein